MSLSKNDDNARELLREIDSLTSKLNEISDGGEFLEILSLRDDKIRDYFYVSRSDEELHPDGWKLNEQYVSYERTDGEVTVFYRRRKFATIRENKSQYMTKLHTWPPASGTFDSERSAIAWVLTGK